PRRRGPPLFPYTTLFRSGVPRLGMVSRRGITATISDGFIVSPLLKCRQAVSEPDPAHAVTEPRMMGRRKCFGRVEAAGGDVHGTRGIGVLIGERRSAGSAESTANRPGRMEHRRPPRNELELRE